MAAKGSSDDGGRRGQQQRRLRLRCDFVAASSVGYSKGATTIGRRWGSDVHSCCRGGQQRYRVRDGYCCVQFVAGCDQDSWQGRQQIDGSTAWWATMEATSKAIVGIAWEGGDVDDGYRGSKIAALISDDRTPEGAL
ncbi:hypothetical protein BHE74_00039761 [Ensete ventricosum]|nr:hypothetical protein BHE74_00039761 [Ensete ventricosum]